MVHGNDSDPHLALRAEDVGDSHSHLAPGMRTILIEGVGDPKERGKVSVKARPDKYAGWPRGYISAYNILYIIRGA